MALNLAQLHEVLQASFGWTDSHLHQFNIRSIIYGAPEFDDDGFSANRSSRQPSCGWSVLFFLRSRRTAHTIPYEYDFGDNWRHLLRLERHRARQA